MDKREVIIITLLILAILFSSVSIILNFNLVAPFRHTINGYAVKPTGNVAISVDTDVEILNDGTK